MRDKRVPAYVHAIETDTRNDRTKITKRQVIIVNPIECRYNEHSREAPSLDAARRSSATVSWRVFQRAVAKEQIAPNSPEKCLLVNVMRART
jgi:hypothetical protein